MRHLNRTHGVDISAMKEQFDKENIIIQYTQTDRQCADVHTKAFDNKDKWMHTVTNINIFDMHHFDLATVSAGRQLPPADPKEPKLPSATSCASCEGATCRETSRRVPVRRRGRCARCDNDATRGAQCAAAYSHDSSSSGGGL